MKLKEKTALVTGSSRSIGKGIAQALEKELGSRNITVNAISPGWIETALNRDFWQ